MGLCHQNIRVQISQMAGMTYLMFWRMSCKVLSSTGRERRRTREREKERERERVRAREIESEREKSIYNTEP